MKDYLASTIQSYDKTVKKYAKNVAPLHPFDMSDRFISLLPKNAYILDVGCGSGRDAQVFISHGCRVIGIDLSEKMVKFAQNNVKDAEFQVMDLRQLSFNDNYFDGLWASASYLHIKKGEIEAALHEALRVIKLNGIMYLSVKEGTGETCEVDKRYGNYEKFWSYFKKVEIESLLKKIGFEVIFINQEKRNSSYATHPFIHIMCKKKF